MKQKLLVAALALTLVLCLALGATLAWLTTRTQTITNTFTYGNITLTLTETTGTEYKGAPGSKISKDPKVTVKAGSETCWVYVKIEETDPDNAIFWLTAAGWNQLYDEGNAVEGVYYREVTASDKDQSFEVLSNNEVIVETGVNSTSASASLTITAYACQIEERLNPLAAWMIVEQLPAPVTTSEIQEPEVTGETGEPDEEEPEELAE